MSKRYKVKRFSSCYLMNWVDNKTNKELTALEIEEILHKQEKRIAELEEQLKNCIKPKFKIGQTLYMIPTQSNGLSKIKDYILLSVSLSDIGIRYDLSLKEKEKGIEPFYCASEDMFEKSIFATRDEAEKKFDNKMDYYKYISEHYEEIK